MTSQRVAATDARGGHARSRAPVAGAMTKRCSRSIPSPPRAITMPASVVLRGEGGDKEDCFLWPEPDGESTVLHSLMREF